MAPPGALAQSATTEVDDTPPGSQRPVLLRFSPGVWHYGYNPEHRHVWLAGLDWPVGGDGAFCGGALFSNSFGQPSAYAYVGHVYEAPFGVRDLYWHWSAGLLYGYRGRFQHKVPLNHHGFSPGLVPTLGWHVSRYNAVEISALGTAGLMFSWVVALP